MSGSALLQVRGLAKAFGGVKAVDGVSFELAAGELLALIGPNGAGKSTCFNCINGQLRPDSGQVLLDGHEIAGRSPQEIWRLGVGRTFQIAATWSSMTVSENVQLALLSRAGRLAQWWGRAARMQREQALGGAGDNVGKVAQEAAVLDQPVADRDDRSLIEHFAVRISSLSRESCFV